MPTMLPDRAGAGEAPLACAQANGDANRLAAHSSRNPNKSLASRKDVTPLASSIMVPSCKTNLQLTYYSVPCAVSVFFQADERAARAVARCGHGRQFLPSSQQAGWPVPVSRFRRLAAGLSALCRE